MATRIYKDIANFDAQQGHFTIEEVDSQYYLRIGALNSEDRRLIASLIEDGFVGFFQDEVRIAIAGMAATYDPANDRIEIDSALPELQIEDEYVIRFTQARPGEDGGGGIGTPGEDGEHAEIEVEDTDTGIRVRGKSGGAPDFGPWQDVRDGIDGQDGVDGQNGEPGQDGDDGEHAEIEVEDTSTGIRVRGKSGGAPDFGPWQDVRDGIDGQDGKDGKPGQDGEEGQDGEPGQDGNDGENGEDGWSPKFATVPDGERRVLQVADWFGGGGTKPDIGQYIGETGLVAAIAEGVDIRGPAGQDGEDGQDGADSTVPGPQGPQGPPGEDGEDGPAGPQGPPGRDSIGNILFSAASYNPSVRQVIYKLHGNSAGWRSGGISADFVNITNLGGRWLRWGDVVLVYGCFEVSTGQYVPNGMDELSVYLSLPQGATGTGGHGMGMPLDNANLTFTLSGNQVQNKLIFTPLNGSKEKVDVEGDSIENGYSHKFGGWIPINPVLGDHTTAVSNSSQKPTEGRTSNSLKIILRDPSGVGNKFTGLQGFSMIYSVVS